MIETTLPGKAGPFLAGLAAQPVLHDLYDAVGAPIYHDLAVGDTSEIRELLSIVRRIPGPVLELAAGSGRLTVPLLALGRNVTALELSGDMLDLLRQQLAHLPTQRSARCTLVHADMSNFALGTEFPVIVLGTTSISLLDADGRAGLFRTVRAHLRPGGRFVLSNVNIPTADAAGSDQEYQVAGISGRRYRIFEHWPAGSLRRIVTIIAEDDGTALPTVCTTSIGVLPLDLLEHELSTAGLTVRSRTPLPSNGLHYDDVLLEVEAL